MNHQGSNKSSNGFLDSVHNSLKTALVSFEALVGAINFTFVDKQFYMSVVRVTDRKKLDR